jgi:hypothetical protein
MKAIASLEVGQAPEILERLKKGFFWNYPVDFHWLV